ncbi:hypothetical protein NDU88_001568 [Pleurodeles waltl]|uniref:Uncharacterized protein n=1 Tax=Pleurodeles waltl TaxID=8319 RepID=A0AAV7MKS9_PLEWA|nr:hypothetical protein NDU88_001568 [Pleurodeles waltl]
MRTCVPVDWPCLRITAVKSAHALATGSWWSDSPRAKQEHTRVNVEPLPAWAGLRRNKCGEEIALCASVTEPRTAGGLRWKYLEVAAGVCHITSEARARLSECKAITCGAGLRYNNWSEETAPCATLMQNGTC